MSKVAYMTKGELIKSLNEHVKEIVLRYNASWDGYIELDKRYRSLESSYNELKEDNDLLEGNDLLDEKFGQFQYDCGYEKGFEKGENSMQEKAKKIVDFWDETDDEEIEDVFSDMEYGSAFENINESYDKIVAYEKKKEQEEKKLHIGDEVLVEGIKYVVHHLEDDYASVLTYDGTGGFLKYSDVSKTGKHYPLEEILKELENETIE